MIIDYMIIYIHVQNAIFKFGFCQNITFIIIFILKFFACGNDIETNSIVRNHILRKEELFHLPGF